MADPLDLLTLDEALTAIHDQDADPTVVAAYVTAISRMIDAETLAGPVVARPVTEEFDGGVKAVQLRRGPVLSITSVVEYDGTTENDLQAETHSSQPAAGYALDQQAPIVYRRANGGDAIFPWGRRNVVVTYQAGRYTDTNSVDPKFKAAAAMCLRHLWRSEEGSGNQMFGQAEGWPVTTPFSVPNAVRQMLADEVSPPGFA